MTMLDPHWQIRTQQYLMEHFAKKLVNFTLKIIEDSVPRELNNLRVDQACADEVAWVTEEHRKATIALAEVIFPQMLDQLVKLLEQFAADHTREALQLRDQILAQRRADEARWKRGGTV